MVGDCWIDLPWEFSECTFDSIFSLADSTWSLSSASSYWMSFFIYGLCACTNKLPIERFESLCLEVALWIISFPLWLSPVRFRDCVKLWLLDIGQIIVRLFYLVVDTRCPFANDCLSSLFTLLLLFNESAFLIWFLALFSSEEFWLIIVSWHSSFLLYKLFFILTLEFCLKTVFSYKVFNGFTTFSIVISLYLVNLEAGIMDVFPVAASRS
jgi:hypothetical protein